MTTLQLLNEIQISPTLMHAQSAGGTAMVVISKGFCCDFAARINSLGDVTMEMAADLQHAINAAPFETDDLATLTAAIETARSSCSALQLSPKKRCNQSCEAIELFPTWAEWAIIEDLATPYTAAFHVWKTVCRKVGLLLPHERTRARMVEATYAARNHDPACRDPQFFKHTGQLATVIADLANVAHPFAHTEFVAAEPGFMQQDAYDYAYPDPAHPPAMRQFPCMTRTRQFRKSSTAYKLLGGTSVMQPACKGYGKGAAMGCGGFGGAAGWSWGGGAAWGGAGWFGGGGGGMAWPWGQFDGVGCGGGKPSWPSYGKGKGGGSHGCSWYGQAPERDRAGAAAERPTLPPLTNGYTDGAAPARDHTNAAAVESAPTDVDIAGEDLAMVNALKDRATRSGVAMNAMKAMKAPSAMKAMPAAIARTKGKVVGKGGGKGTIKKPAAAAAALAAAPLKVCLAATLKRLDARKCSQEAFGCRGWSKGNVFAKSKGASDAVVRATRSACRTVCIDFWKNANGV